MGKKLNLSRKLSFILGIILLAVFVLLITMTAVLSRRAISQTVMGELNNKAKMNGIQIQQIFDEADKAAGNVKQYMERSYESAEETPMQARKANLASRKRMENTTSTPLRNTITLQPYTVPLM